MPKLILLLLALAPMALLFGPPEPDGDGGGPALTGQARVVDGDTLHLGAEEIRLHGIDAPEAEQRCTDARARDYACGREAAAALARLAAGGATTCTGRDRDRYSRLLAVCTTGGTELNRAMVSAGWALAYRRYADTYVDAEAAAEDGRRGLWAGGFVAPWDWRRGDRLAAAPEPAVQQENCRIKGNISENGRIYHAPGSRHYARTRIDPSRGERWFCSAEEALQAGWRAPRG